jgi:PAS domain S-box-containing protein
VVEGLSCIDKEVTETGDAQRSLIRFKAIGELIERILPRFAGCSHCEMDEMIGFGLRSLAEFLGADHAYVLLLSPDKTSWSCTNEWCAPGVSPQKEKMQVVPFGALPWSENRVIDGEVINICSNEDYPAGEASADRADYVGEGAISILNIPIRNTAGQVTGCMEFHGHASSVSPAEDDMANLRLIGDCIANLLERKRKEMALAASEACYRTLFEAANDAVFMHAMKPDGALDTFVTVNDRICQILGYSREELGRLSLNEITHPDDLAMDEAQFNRLLAGVIGSYSVDKRFIRKDGSVVYTVTSIAGVRQPEGSMNHMVGLMQDITGRKNAEKALSKSEYRLRTILQTANEGFWVVDNDSVVTDTNPRMCRILGRGKGEIVGRKVFDFADDENKAVFEEQFRLRNQRKSGVYEIAVSRPDGSQVFCRFNATPLFDESGNKVGSFAMVTDITARKRAEEEKERLESQLRRAQKLQALGTLAGGIAHDFNNILAPIIGYAEMSLSDLPRGNPMRSWQDQILNAARRARDLVKQIMLFGRHEGDPERTPVEIGPIVGETLKLLRASLPSSIRIDEHIEDVMAKADPTQINQVLLNLCTNAAHAMGNKGVMEVRLARVELSASDLTDLVIVDLKPGPHLKLSVSDTGSGMEADTLERIFDPYFTTKEVGKGSGLGLAVVHGIVKHHDGAITVESQPGKGSIFSIYIPGLENVVETAGEITPVMPKGTDRILLLDDEQVVLDLGTEVLERLGYAVTPENSSLHALETFRSRPHEFDLVITDYTMPNLNGMDIAREVRRIRPNMPIILCTGFSEEVTRENAVGLNVELIMKPFGVKQLGESIRKVLDLQ